MRRYTFFIVILPFTLLSQVKWEKTEPSVFMDVVSRFEKSIAENENYSFDTQYDFYKGYFDSIPVKTTHGSLVSNKGKEINVHQLTYLMIQNSELNLTIDTIQKKLVIQFPDSSFFYRKSVNDFAKLSELAKDVYKKGTDINSTYLIELKDGLPYHAIEFVVSNNALISEVTIFSNSPYESEEYTLQNEDSRAKIRLSFYNYKKGKEVNLSDFVFISDCVSIDKKTKEVKPLIRYSGYEIIDLRN